jgi:16S rRNA (guanine527-N7)-methyltransferase
MAVEAQLVDGLTSLGLQLAPDAQERLLRYVTLLQKWNRTYNLTAIRESSRLVTHHLLDCLATVPHMPDGTLVDIGSGAGLPGIPLAIAQPDRAITLLDSNHKKGAFLRQATIDCVLPNVEVHVGRAEEWESTARFDVAVSRAFSDLAGFADAARGLVKPGGVLAAMKGVYPDEELSTLPSTVQLEQAIPLQVPGLKAARHLLLLRVAG